MITYWSTKMLIISCIISLAIGVAIGVIANNKIRAFLKKDIPEA